MFVSGIYKATPPTLTDGTEHQVLLDSLGNVKVAGTVTVTDFSVLGALDDDPVTDPEAAAASVTELLRGQLELMSDDSPVSVIQSGTWTYIDSNATTNVRTSAGKLHRLVVSAAGASSNTVTVYDANAGTTNPVAIYTNIAIGTYEFLADMANGITIVTATGTAPKMLVVSSAA